VDIGALRITGRRRTPSGGTAKVCRFRGFEAL
jgi:hypothetical protein